MRTKIMAVMTLIVIAAAAVAGFMYKDVLLEMAGLGGGSEDYYAPQATWIDSAESATDNASYATPATKQSEIFRNSCNNGNYDYCISLAKLFLDGDGAEKDAFTAISILVKSCEAKHADSCWLLAELYDKGEQVIASPHLYLGYVDKACELGSLDACYDLGVKYYRGKGELISKDVMKAFRLFKDTCDKGKVESCNNLAVIYNNGKNGITKNAKLARSLFEDACKKGYQPSCNNLEKISF